MRTISVFEFFACDLRYFLSSFPSPFGSGGVSKSGLSFGPPFGGFGGSTGVSGGMV